MEDAAMEMSRRRTSDQSSELDLGDLDDLPVGE